MTQLNYSNLPPEAQEGIKKLTGYTDEELEGSDQGKTPKPPRRKNQSSEKPISYYLTRIASYILIIAGCWGIIILICYLSD